ncbi:MAG TPA: DUF433 domain-containing protein [Bryobacteraceae bacterium]|jgi:uncharacterized protein (DUF433 family)
MTTIKIDLSDQQAASLAARAAAQGLVLESWIQKLVAAAPESVGGPTGVIDWSQCPAVESVPGKVSGAWVLKGTRMPVSAIFENLEAGANIDDIMEWFAGLDRDQVEAVIEFAARSLDKPPSYGL